MPSVMAHRPADRAIRITSADYGLSAVWPVGEAPTVAEPLALPKAAIARFAQQVRAGRGIDLRLASEAQPGTGLGSSSAMAVALVLALGAHSGLALTPEEVADLACCLEIDYLGMPIGKQDQLRCRVDRGGARLAAVDRNRMGLLGCAAIEPSNDDDRDEYASRRSPESRRLVQVRRSSGSGMDPGVALRTASGPVGGAGSSTVTREQGIGRG